MKIQTNVLARFVSDQKLPIQILEEPYFSYFLDLYDKDFDTRNKYQMLLDTLSKYDSQQEFLEEFYRIRDDIITKLKSTEAYERFIDSNNPDFLESKDNIPKFYSFNECCGVMFSKKSDVYTPNNNGKYFLSIDLKKANFQVLKKYDKEIVFGADTYEEMISNFTDLEYIKNSKYIREVIFGSISTGRQIVMEKHYTAEIIKCLIKHEIATKSDFAVFTNDEVVLNQDKYLSPERCDEIKKLIYENLDLEVSVESFKLVMIGEKDYYAKELSTGKVSFKAIPAAYYPQVYKKYKNIPINEYDLMFYFEKRLAKFIKPMI